MKADKKSMQDPSAEHIETILASADGLAQVPPSAALEGRILRRLAAEMEARPQVVTIGFRLRMAAVVLLLLVNSATLLYFLRPPAQARATKASSVEDYWSYTQDNRF